LRAILTEPRNSLVRQFQHLFQMDDVELLFTEAALQQAAEMAIVRETGARGLRSIVENALLEVMYEVPSTSEVRQVIVDEKAIAGTARPRLIDANGQDLDDEESLGLAA
jgi:ATP-dependent Clp protease ATP-binding subunit ClpX